MGQLHITKTNNNLLLALIVLVNLYVVVTPLVPSLLFTLGSHTGRQQELVQKLHQKPASNSTGPAKPSTSQPNSLIIPTMLLDQPILEGRDTYAVLNKGLLRLPASSTPDKGSNTVIIGHRFTYTQPKGAFYHLDKLAVGDEIGVTWNNTQYIYKVSGSKIVPPTEVSVQAPTETAQLTLFTCTPLAWPKDRLVITATLASVAGTPKEAP